MPQMIEDDNISIKRKKLIFRSWHRGTREIDLMLGRFADAMLPGFSLGQLDMYEGFLGNNDPDIFNWITGAETSPSGNDGEIVALLLAFYKKNC